jgi:hypothetical protein
MVNQSVFHPRQVIVFTLKENIFCGSENDDVFDNSTLNVGLLLPDGLSAPLLERSLVLHDSFAAVDPDFITQNVEVVSDG